MKSYILLLSLALGSIATPSWAKEQEKFVVYYADKAPIEAFDQYSLLVLDNDVHPKLEPLLARKKTLLGYISLGEVEQPRAHYKEAKSSRLLLSENENWKGSYAVDIRNPKWQAMVIERLVPDILRKGFHGIFIDTLDTPIELERQYPHKYHGMQKAAISLIKAIHLHYPEAKIMVNRAYPILPEVADTIDMVLGESVFSSYDFDRKSYSRVERNLYKQQVQMLKDAQSANPQLAVYTLDYCNKYEPQTISSIYQEQRKNGFIPYVATIGLDEIIREPGE